jgi:peptide deformylase
VIIIICEGNWMRNIKKVLSISQYGCGDKLLESHVPLISTSEVPKTLIKEMEYLTSTAAHHKLLSLSANQIRINQRMFAILKRSTI